MKREFQFTPEEERFPSNMPLDRLKEYQEKAEKSFCYRDENGKKYSMVKVGGIGANYGLGSVVEDEESNLYIANLPIIHPIANLRIIKDL